MTDVHLVPPTSVLASGWRRAAMVALLVIGVLFALVMALGIVLTLVDPPADGNLALNLGFTVAVAAVLAGPPLLGAWLLRRGLLRGYVVGAVIPLLLTVVWVVPPLLGKARGPHGAWDVATLVLVAAVLIVVVVAGIVDAGRRARQATVG